jgi:hypothetical protein
MKKLLFSCLLAFGITAQAQFSENFDAGTTAPAGWRVINGGGASTFIFAVGSSGSALSAPNAAQINYDAVAHNDFLVTPAISVVAGVNDRLTYYVKNQDPAYVESYDVKISTVMPTSAANFTAFIKANGPAPNVWTQVVLDLTPYVGQTIYVGLHATATDMFRLLFDNVVNDTAPALAVSDETKVGASVYPNPFTDVLKISDVKGVKSISISDVSGKLVKTVKATAEIQVSELKTGLYIVNLNMEDGSVKSIKAIKK